MVNSWDDVLKYSWITPDGVAFFTYVKDGWLYYYFEDRPTSPRKWLNLKDNRWAYLNSYRQGEPNPHYQEFIGPMQVPISPVVLKIRQMEQRRKHA